MSSQTVVDAPALPQHGATCAARLDRQQIEAFGRDGAIVVRGLIDMETIGRLRNEFDLLKSEAQDISSYYSAGSAPGRTLLREGNWRVSALFRDIIFRSGIAEAAALAMRSGAVRLYEDLLIYKAAGSGQSTPWHQDAPQWPVSGHQLASVWLSLEPVTAQTGALRFVRGSHKGPVYIPYLPEDRREALAADMRFFDGGPVPDIDAAPERYPVISFDTEPGDVVIFSTRTLHAAFGSDPDRPRRTFTIRFLGDDVRWQPKQSVFHDWLGSIALKEGDPISGERFPVAWSGGEARDRD